MKKVMIRVILLLLLFVGYQMANQEAAYAQDDALRPAKLTIQPLEEGLMAGQKIIVVAELLNIEGRAIPNAPLLFFLDGEQLRRKRTDDNGIAEFTIRKGTLKRGTYTANIVYDGSKVYQPAEETISLDIKSALLEIEVVPPIEGITFSLKKLPEPEPASTSKPKSDTSENQAAEDANATDEQSTDEQSTDEQASDEQAADEQTSDESATDEQAADEQASDEQAAENQESSKEKDPDALTPEEEAALETAPEWQATSDADGMLRFELEEGGNYYLAIVGESAAEEITIEFERWADKGFEPQRKISLPRADTLQVGFETYHIVTQSFFDPDGQPVSMDRIESFTIKSSHGTTHEFEKNEPHSLQTARVVKRRTGLAETKIYYSAQSVVIDGSNVVNKGEQCFFVSKSNDPEEDPSLAAVPKRCTNAKEWKIDLLLYSVKFSAIDGVFQFGVGSGVFLHYPDERIEEVPFGEDGTVQLHNLARGIYKAQVMDVSGMAPLTPVAVSRNQEVPLKVLTALDMGVAFSLGLILAIGLLYLGRPQWFNWFLPARFHRQARLRPITAMFRFTSGMQAAIQADHKLDGMGQAGDSQSKPPTIGQRLSRVVRNTSAHLTESLRLTTPTRFIIKLMEQKQEKKQGNDHWNH